MTGRRAVSKRSTTNASRATQGASHATVNSSLDEEFSEIIFFKDEAAVANFKRDEFELSAQASAVIAESGGGTKADYSNGIAVFVLPKSGAMLEASVGGQKIEYRSR